MISTEALGAEAWERLLRVHASLVPAFAREVERRSGLPLSWYDVLYELKSASEQQLRMTELGEKVVLSRTRVSRIVDEMVQAGLVERTPDPEDGRASLARLTSAGVAAQRKAGPIYLEAIHTRFTSRLDENELRILVRALDRVLEDDAPDQRATRAPGQDSIN